MERILVFSNSCIVEATIKDLKDDLFFYDLVIDKSIVNYNAAFIAADSCVEGRSKGNAYWTEFNLDKYNKLKQAQGF